MHFKNGCLERTQFLSDKHVSYLLKALKKMPSSLPLGVAEINRLSSLFFIISGLDLLNAIDDNLNQEDKEQITDWVYSFQVNPSKATEASTTLPHDDLQSMSKDNHERRSDSVINPNDQAYNPQRQKDEKRKSLIHGDEKVKSNYRCGFRDTSTISDDISTDCGNIAMTYCALATLIILGDDLSRVNRRSIIDGIRHIQLPDGSFQPSVLGGESDMRFVYCVVATSYILNDWSGIDINSCIEFIRKSMSYEGAFGQCPGAEAHGGSTYCALAALKLMNRIDVLSQDERDTITRWCLNRFDNGFAGRPNKDQDVCYSFWIGACLVILDAFQFVNQSSLLDFMLAAQEDRGGLGKVPQYYPDLLHTYLGIAGMSFIEGRVADPKKVSLNQLDVTLNISSRAGIHLYKRRDDTH